jgi:hypothetical protein
MLPTVFSIAVIGIAIWQFDGWLMWLFIIIGVGNIIGEVSRAISSE